MDAMQRLDEHLNSRTLELAKLKGSGRKIAGYFLGGFVPEEMIHAAGAVPLGLGRGGDPEPTIQSLSMMPRFLCTYCRSQIGYWKLGEELTYRLPQILLSPVVDFNQKSACDAFDYYAGIPTYRLGIPHDKTPQAAAYFRTRLVGLKAKLEEFTGNEITDEKLRSEIELGNRRRDLFRAISKLRIDANPVISSKEYLKLHHASLLADRDFFLDILQEVYDERSKLRHSSEELRHPRIMLVASTLANGDNRINDILNVTGGEVVFEEAAEGIQPYENNVTPEGELLDALVEAYFVKRLRGPWDRPYGDRFERLLAKAREYDVDGVIWYETLYRDGMDIQALPFGEMFKEAGIPFVKIQTEYTAAEKGPMRNRIETFVDMISKREVEALV